MGSEAPATIPAVVAPLRIATRDSALARWQAEHVARLLRQPTELVAITPLGDRDKSTPLSLIGGHGVFVKEVQAAVLDGRADIAVHSAKDVPSSPELLPDELTLGAVPMRADPRDVLVGRALHELDEGATVATGSPRRRVQLAALRPDLWFIDLRGNVPTRVRKVPPGGAVITAMAAMERLGSEDEVAEVFDVTTFVPQVGQGALAVECRFDDERSLGALADIEHPPSRTAVDAERAWLGAMGGDCQAPVAAHATVAGRQITLSAMIVGGNKIWRRTQYGTDPRQLGSSLARAMVESMDAAP